MLDQIRKIIKTNNLSLYKNSGISVCKVNDQTVGFQIISEIIYNIADKKSVLYLSGGSTPRELYRQFTAEETLNPGAVGMIDERYGDKFHDNSNEKMINDTELLRYLKIRDVAFYPILKPGLTREETATDYDSVLRSLISSYPRHIGILGMGSDGHTAGIAGNRSDFANPLFGTDRKNLYVSEFDDPKSSFKQRITLTFLGLSMLDLAIVLVFGKEKKPALRSMFEKGSEEDIPARFYKRLDMSPKTLIITDQDF